MAKETRVALRDAIGDREAVAIRLYDRMEYPPGSGTYHENGETISVSGPFPIDIVVTGPGRIDIIDTELAEAAAHIVRDT
jgi:hypothetical protein